MRKLFGIGLLCVLGFVKAQTWKTEDQYVQKFAPYAVEEMEKYKIPASITLAQGLLETGGGQSRLAQLGKNHFGIKCKEDWTGKTMSHTDDAPNECFRVYEDPKQSYEDHSIFLATRKYYTKLFDLDPKDYKAWAHGLKKAGYATNPKYAHILISKIEKYKLYEFDNTTKDEVYYAILKLYPSLNNDAVFMAQLGQEKQNDKVTPPTVKVPYSQGSYAKKKSEVSDIIDSKTKVALLKNILVKNHPNGDLKFFIMPVDANVSDISKKFGISEKRLIKYNELENSKLEKNDIIFLEGKNSSGNTATYKAGIGETMHDIAQKFGIKLKKLYSKNRMEAGQEPKAGQLIYLQSKKPR
ncbi:glucosaminidase domain-containing protein [Epilithonimonas hispanica]|uniref:Mannosyl-glycoprotein endo-beta-N-acetylglucosamidase n=1 Tax=Epilithonimonas hispanica TaxID=358687 RepID=A0A3D9D3C4_9FLAO|nr:glucosaminidase domain-containing protein [Epilithonimonas hispanica]REC72499.1 mannosyl-glycoprotein endo-beta-N-acetylglucosamidase [Epilithonimonas hispanica]